MKRAKPFLFPPLTGLLILSLGLQPLPAYGMREMTPIEGRQRAGLEESLGVTQEGDLPALVEQLSFLHGEVAAGRPIPNQVVLSFLEPAGGSVWLRNTIASDRPTFATTIGLFHFLPVVPDSSTLPKRSVSQPGKVAGYVAEANLQAVTDLLHKENTAGDRLSDLILSGRKKKFSPSKKAAGPWLAAGCRGFP